MRSMLAPLCSALVAILAAHGVAHAQNPAWPNRSATRAEMSDPANWPDDPSYGYDVSGTGSTCIPGTTRCFTNSTGGQWNLWSWTPAEATARDTFRAPEADLGSGAWTDMAWTLTTGSRRVLIAILDSGINWDEGDLANQHYINRAELEAPGLDPRCLPQPPASHTGDPIDVNGDGSLSMRDYYEGHPPAEIAAIKASLDDAGNQNGVAEPGDLIVLCSDSNDDDGNGYTDDISGWDFFMDDNDPSDDTRFGHGTGEARWSVAEANNGEGRAGFCPNCAFMMVRAGDSFVADSQDFAQAVVFATDSGANVVQEALGTINHTTYMRRAIDYAYDHDTLVIASAADENSRHHNLPGTANHDVYIHAIQYAGSQPQTADSFLAYNNCSNYGGQLVLSGAGTGCSSEATAVGAGISALVYSASIAADRPGGPLDPPLSAEETRQMLLMGAQDIDVPESRPGSAGYDPEIYPSRPGWDQRFGYGRINAYQSTLAAWEGRIPPEVDLTNPDWFRVLYPDRTPTVTLRGKMAARRATDFDYTIEWAAGIEPGDSDWQSIASDTGVTGAMDGDLTSWDISGIHVDNPGEVENRFSVTVRIRVTAHYPAPIGDVMGEQRRVYAVVRDPSLEAGFPLALGTRATTDIFPGASGEGSPRMADIDGDGRRDIVYGDADGLLHVINEDASEAPGFPVQLGHLRGFDPSAPDNLLGAPAYASGDVPSADLASSVLATPAIGDLDGDGSLEIVGTTMEGDVYVVEPDGSMRAGFPAAMPEVLSGDTLRGGPVGPNHVIERGAFASPALADLDDDGKLEIVQPAFDGHVYVYREDGSQQPGWPVEITAPVLWVNHADAASARIMTSAAIGDANGDGLLDIAVGGNEVGDDDNTGAIHLLHGDGTLHAGGAEHANWPIKVTSLHLLPLVGYGTSSAVAMADVTGDGIPELAITGNASTILIVPGVQPARAPGEPEQQLLVIDSGGRGPLSDITAALDRPLLNTFSSGAFTDLDQDGQPDYSTGGAGLSLAANLAGGYLNKPFSHELGVWHTTPDPMNGRGAMLPGFPRHIEDYMFFVNPTSADVNGDGYPEMTVGSGGYYVHAFDGCGREPEGWPKFVGGWVTASPAIGDVDGDGKLELAVTTRAGYLFLFDTDGSADGSTPWPEYRHDSYNTGNYNAPLTSDGRAVTAATPLECPLPPVEDGGVGDGGVDGGVGDAGIGGGGGGCGCRVASSAGRDGAHSLGALLLSGLALGWRRRR